MLIEAGLRIAVDDKEPYDRFRDRLTMPIHDARGRVIGFAARILDAEKKDAPKYLNSPDTPLFDKGRTLFNLHRAGPASRQSGRDRGGRRPDGRDRARRGGDRGSGRADGHRADRAADRAALAPDRQADPVLRRRCRRPPRGDARRGRARCRCCARAIRCSSSPCPPGWTPTTCSRSKGARGAGSAARGARQPARHAVAARARRRPARLARGQGRAQGAAARPCRDDPAPRHPVALPPRPDGPVLGVRVSARASSPSASSPASAARNPAIPLRAGRVRRTCAARPRATRATRWRRRCSPASPAIPDQIARHAEALLEPRARRAAAGPARSTSLLEAAERLNPGAAPHIGVAALLKPPPDSSRFSFLVEGTDPQAAREDLAEAVSLLVERPALEAAIAAATARFETDPEGAFAEQQRLRQRKLEIESRLGHMARKRAASAALQIRRPAGPTARGRTGNRLKQDIMASDDTTGTTDDAPLIDLNEASIKKLIAKAKRRGYITVDELNEALPQDQMSTDQIEDVMSAISRDGRQHRRERRGRGRGGRRGRAEEIAAADDDEDGRRRFRPRPRKEEGRHHRAHRRPGADVPARDGRGRAAQPRRRDRHRQAHRGRPRHDDHGPVRKPDHLPRDHHVVRSAQQRRDAAARDPRSRRDAVEGTPGREDGGGERGRRQRRDQRRDRRPVVQGRGRARGRGRGSRRARRGRRAARRAAARKRRKRTTPSASRRWKPRSSPRRSSASRASPTCSRSSRSSRPSASTSLGRGEDFPTAKEKKYEELREQLTAEVESVQFHATKIEFLVDNLYAFNRRLTALGGQMLRLAERHKVKRADFLAEYVGHELDEAWLAHDGQEGQEVGRVRRDRGRGGRAHPRRDRRHRRRHRHGARRVPPDRQHGPEGRARGAHRQEGNGRGQPAPGDLASPRSTPTAGCSSST